MQALTPLLFSMLFPRSGNTTPERRNSRSDNNDYPRDSLLSSQSSADRRYSFHDGYLLDRDDQTLSTKTRRHRSAGSARRSATEPTLNINNNNNNNDNTISSSSSSVRSIHRNSTFPQSRKANPPKRLSIDHAAFMATYPMLDGLGDTVRTSEEEYYGPLINATSSKPRASSSKARKQRSQESLAISRASTSSLCSLVSDDSMSCSSSSSSIREPLTPTRSTDYHSIMRMGSPANKTGKVSPPPTATATNTATTKDLVDFSENTHLGMPCLSPQSNNFFDDGETIIGYKASTGVESRGQRRLIAH
ncbi:hypothetical protein BGZ80_007457 [Entomortierella chlamydospora]|uniref:Uncharacterized protein n=1 Tax=Entomortierella chlamydospora TaxID=101097 RepID=A0A9P6MET4_9FUNG|nr:hypothetical protein BGZ79_002254 [Entomortierella chlamydospora]KAF9995664.1 hypothetical protein BGZ80_007457 [Entomortierella chlamydospora]